MCLISRCVEYTGEIRAYLLTGSKMPDEEMVLLIRTRRDGTVVRAWMPHYIAVAEVGYHERNGWEYASARIVADDIDMGLWDRSI